MQGVHAQKARAKKLTYVALAIGLVLSVVSGFLPSEYQWFLGGVVVGILLAFCLLFSNLFWSPPQT